MVTTEQRLERLAKQANYKSATIFSENLIDVHMARTKVKLDKPIYLGISILNLSKTLMYDFFYDYIKPMYGENAKLLMTDTDSLVLEIKTEDLYKGIKDRGDHRKYFDFSNYPKDHPCGLHGNGNKKVPGLMKDECGGGQITEFCGRRPKMYAIKVENGGETKRLRALRGMLSETN